MAPLLSMNRRRLIERAATALLLLYALASVGIILTSGRYQWDFAIYYFGTTVHAAGENPYDLGRISDVAGMTVTIPFVYPPVALWLFRPFLLLDLHDASILFLLLKCVVFTALFVLWRRWLPDTESRTLLLAIFCAFAFREAVKADFRAGNIAIFEQLPLWIGAWGFLHRRPWIYVAGVLVAASMKGTLILLLPLVLIDRNRHALAAFSVGTLIFGAYHLAQYLAAPELYMAFLRMAAGLDERGQINPSSLALIRDGVDLIAPDHPRRTTIAWWVYGAYATAIVGTAYVLLRRLDLRRERIIAVVAAFLLYGLLVPRFKGYSYVMMIVPAIIAVLTVVRRPVPRFVAILLVSVTLFPYQPFIVLLLLTIGYLWKSTSSS
jgi:hypothetical protein